MIVVLVNFLVVLLLLNFGFLVFNVFLLFKNKSKEEYNLFAGF